MAQKEKETFEAKLLRIQCELTAKKDNTNGFGKYNYRTAEGIMEKLKPLMQREQLLGWFHNEKIISGNVFHTEYTITDMDGKCINTQYELPLDFDLKGMSKGQMSGASTSYARKYLLCGLFCIDGGDHDLDDPSITQAVANANSEADKVNEIVDALSRVHDQSDLNELYLANKQFVSTHPDVLQKFTDRKNFLMAQNA